jgi:hypothetical protein
VGRTVENAEASTRYKELFDEIRGEAGAYLAGEEAKAL